MHPDVLASLRTTAAGSRRYVAAIARADGFAAGGAGATLPDLAAGGTDRPTWARIAVDVPVRVLRGVAKPGADFAGAVIPVDAVRLGFAPDIDVRAGDVVTVTGAVGPALADPPRVVTVVGVPPFSGESAECIVLATPAAPDAVASATAAARMAGAL